MGGAVTRRSKPKNWYQRLDEDFRATILGIGFITFLALFAVSNLPNSIVASSAFAMFGGSLIAGFAFVFGLAFLITLYGKYRTRTFMKARRDE